MSVEGQRSCDWCQSTPAQDFTVEPVRMGREASSGAWVVKHQAIVAQACKACAERMAPSTGATVIK